MPKPLAYAVLVTVMLAPIAASATPVEVVPQRLTFEIGGRVFGEASASTKGMSIGFGATTCFSPMPAAHDIVRITGLRKQETERGAKMAFDIRAQKAGECTITIKSGNDSSTMTIVVQPEKP